MAGDFVGVAMPTLIYVGIGSREEFDKIARPVHDQGAKNDGNHVLTKVIKQGKAQVIFQHWIKFELSADERREFGKV